MRLRSLGVLVLFAAAAAFAPSALATDYYADVSGGSWTSVSTWHLTSNSGPTASAYPGQNAGDRAIMDFQGETITLSAALPNAVELQENCVSCFVNVQSGGSLPLTTGSVSAGAILQITGGAIGVNSGGTLTINSGSSLAWSSGTLGGAGSTAIASGGALNATGSSLSITGNHSVSVAGTFTHGASAGNLDIASGSSLTILNGGSYDIQNSNGITGGGTITVNSGGTFLKSNGNFGTNILPAFSSAAGATVQTNVNSLVLSNGSHAGSYVMNGASTGFGFAGSPTFQGGMSISGTGTASLANVTLAGSVTATNLSMDSFGSISGSNSLTVSGTFNWRGGTIGGGATVNMSSGSTLNFTGESNATLTGSAHINMQAFSGASTFNVNTGVGSLSISNGGHVTNAGTMNLVGDVTVNSDGTNNARIDNSSVITKNSGASFAELKMAVNNSGSVSTTSGSVKLSGGGTHSGSFNILISGGAIAFAGGTHTFNAGSAMNASASGTYGLTGGVMDVDTNITVGSSAAFQQSGGTLTGSGVFSVPGSFLWTAGTQDNSSGNGQTTVSGSSVQIAPSPSATLSGRTFSMSGTMTYNGSAGSLAISSGATFFNNGTLNYATDGSFTSDGVSSPTFTNNGTINKSTGTGTSAFACRFTAGGGSTINLTSGSFQFNLGGSDLGTVGFGGSSNKLIFNAGTFNLLTAPTITGGGVLVVQNTATLALGTTVTIPNLELLGGTVSGGTLGISNLLTWQGGTMSGGVTNIANTATVDATAPAATLTLSSHSLTNAGTFNWNGTSQNLALTNGSSLINNSIFNATGSGNITSPSGANAITNNGTFKKTGGASGTRIDPSFANGGTLSSEVSGQSLIINGGGSQSGGGMMSTNAGAFLDFFGGTFTVAAGTSPFNGSGIYRVNGGTLAITGNMSLSSPASLVVSSGALDVSTSTTFQVTSFTWNGGTLQNNGTTRVFGGSIGNTAATTLKDNHTLTIPAASFNYNADNVQFLSIIGTANLNVENAANFYLTANGIIGGTSTDGVTVSGNLSKTGSGVARIDVPLTIASGTSVSFGATGGTLQINGGGSCNVTATLDTALSAIVDFSGGTFDLGPSTTVSGTGTIAVSGATLNVNGNLTFPQLQLSAGALSGTGAMSVNGGSWTGGSMTGNGSTTVATAKTFAVSTGTAKSITTRNLGNNGTLNVNDGFTMTGGSTLFNVSQLNLGAVTIACGVTCTGGLNNSAAGTIATTTAGNAIVNVPVTNNGTVSNPTGSLFLNAGGSHSGDFSTGGNTSFGGTHSFSATSDLGGTGTYTFNGTSTLAGTYAAGATTFSTGSTTTFNTTSAASLGTANIAGDVNGSAALTLPSGSNSNWTNGTIGGASTLTIANGGSLLIGGAGSRTLDTRNITNSGSLAISGSLASGPGAASITNLSGFRGIPSGSIIVSPAFDNKNLADFGSGSIAFNGGYTQTAGTTKFTGGSFSSPLTVNINAGSVIGTGTITANVTNDGTFAPGLSPGILTVAGNYTQSSIGVISAEIGGNAPGSGYDQLVVTGTATLAGTLSATFINSFLPADADTFDLVTWGTRVGTFTTVNLPAYSLGTLTTSYEPNSFRITADTVGDLAISKTGPATAAFGSNVSFTITVTNNGPSPSNGVTITDPTPANLTFVSNSGDCTGSFPCTIASIPNGATKTITSTYTVTGGAGTNITNTASVSSTSTDNVSGNNTSSATVFVELSDLAITKTSPARAKPGDDILFTITVANGGASAAQNVVVSDPTPAGLTFLSNSGDCTTAFPCSLGTMASGTTKTITAKYSVSGTLAGSSVTNSATVSTTTTDDPANNTGNATVVVDCLNSAPDNLTPTGTAGGTGTLSWRGSGSSYIVYFGPVGTGCSTQYATTTSRSVSYSDLAPGTYEFRVESLDPNCRTFSSACVTFTVPANCNVPAAPLPRVVGQTTSAKTYSVEWDAVLGAVRYDVEEADNPDFLGITRQTLTGTSQAYKHDVTQPTAFYYRVRAYVDCMTTPGPYSPTVRVVIIPLPSTNTPRKNVNVPAGSQEVIVQEVFIPGEAGQNLFFTATTDRPWLTVRPAAGVITPSGINLEVVADPRNLPNGTFTASVIVTITSSANGPSVNGTTNTTVPISVNLVTPVTPVAAKPSASPYALIIPTAGHLDGIDSHWQSDIRVTNAGFKSARYRITFTPSGGTSQGVKQTEITIDAGATTALDDVISNWFGLGTLGDGANGMLEILPIDDPANTALTTVASSRTYNVSGNGTLGQYIPAVPFPNFIGRALPGALPKVLSLQQIAQNAQYRTNVGLAEASGFPVNAVVSIFNASGAKLKDIPVNLAAGEQRQMNQLLAENGIELSDGRIEVKVTGGDGKVTAYASVVDSTSQDPLLVSGQQLSGTSSKYVLAGVANLNTGIANWQTDMRVFNYGTSSQPATLTFYPFNNGASKSVNVLVGANQVMTLDNLLKSQFDVENQGGVVHLSTPQPASLVVTGRTYNQTSNGTYGQFVPAVTTDQAVGTNGRTLHILQVEDSTRYRTNVGLAEVTGKPAVVELQIVLPDSKITPTVQVPLAANEFRQFNPIRELGVGNVYNARITVRVLSGDGRVTAYGSVIDEVTQDPTYVPAQ